MNYKLYVNGKCESPRSFNANMGIGGVILNEYGKEISFSKNVGIGTCCEAQVYAVLNGLYEILKFKDASSINIYISNLMLVNYLNEKEIDISSSNKALFLKLKDIIGEININMRFEYFEVNDYNYIRTLAEDAVNL